MVNAEQVAVYHRAEFRWKFVELEITLSTIFDRTVDSGPGRVLLSLELCFWGWAQRWSIESLLQNVSSFIPDYRYINST